MSRIGDTGEIRRAVLHPLARETIRSFPVSVRRALGQAIWDLQQGFSIGMPLSKPMPSVAKGVRELRVKDSTGAYRAVYFAQFEAGVLIFHAFVKRTQKTPKKEILAGQRRLKEMLDEEA